MIGRRMFFNVGLIFLNPHSLEPYKAKPYFKNRKWSSCN